MRLIAATLLLALHLAPSFAQGVCALGLPGATEDCPMSSETRRDAPQSAGASLSAYATSCCGADDLCTRSIAALVEAPAVAMGCAPPSHDLLPVPDRIIPSNELTPPSPPPNA